MFLIYFDIFEEKVNRLDHLVIENQKVKDCYRLQNLFCDSCLLIRPSPCPTIKMPRYIKIQLFVEN